MLRHTTNLTIYCSLRYVTRVHSYRAVRTDAGDWTVEWTAAGQIIGHVFGCCATYDEARIGCYEMLRWALINEHKEWRENGIGNPFPVGLRRH
jgi:hypothetical protein